MIKIGLTGGIGSGKSTVAKILEVLGYPVFHSDAVSKELMNSKEVVSEVIATFGKESYQGGLLNRKFLSDQIFADSSKRKLLESIIHPRVREAFNQFAQDSDTKLVFNEAAILFETGANKNFNHIIYVSAPEILRLERVKKRDGVSEEAVRLRMGAQNSDEENRKLADFVVLNDEKQSLIEQVMSILNKIN